MQNNQYIEATISLEDLAENNPGIPVDKLRELIEDHDSNIGEAMLDAGWKYIEENIVDYQ